MVHLPMPQNSTNLLPTVESSLSASTYELLKAIAVQASQMSMPMYLVGGSVRDMLLGAPAKDLDIVVEGDASVLVFQVAKAIKGEVPAYSQFGTAKVKLEGQRFDLVTARRETYSKPGALPSVTPSTIQEDLARRDFSINAMAITMSGPDPGRILDLHGGRSDLRRGVVRVLHSRSFEDDATRILRAVRYEQRFGFKLEEETRVLLAKAIADGMLDRISGSRLRRELEHMLNEDRPHLPISRCGELGILQAIHPPLGNGSKVNGLVGQALESPTMSYLGALTYPMSAQEGEAFIHRLRMASRWAKVVRDTIAVRLKCGEDPKGRPYIGDPALSMGQTCSFLDRFSPASVKVNALLAESAVVTSALEHYLTDSRYVKPALNGTDLISMGVEQGPSVGEVLRELKNARIEGRINTREEELQLARKYVTVDGA